jgi:Large polyvalent protein associated domain 38
MTDCKPSVYLIANNIADAEEAKKVLMHEAVGHHGMKALFQGNDWHALMSEVRERYPQLVQDAADRYGYDIKDDRAVEEAIAREAEREIGTPLERKFMRMIRGALRDMGFKNVGDDFIKDAIARAEDAMISGERDGKPEGGGVMLSKKRSVFLNPDRVYSQDVLDSINHIEHVNKGKLQDLYNEIKKNWKKMFIQGAMDQFHPLKLMQNGTKAYRLAKMSKGATGAYKALFNYGLLGIDKDGAYTVTRGINVRDFLTGLRQEKDDFFRWVAGHRAEILLAEQRERLFRPIDIVNYKSLGDGTLKFDYKLSNGKTTRDRLTAYKDALEKYDAINKNMLDMAEQSGLINAADRKLWENVFYVPFWRAAEDEGYAGMHINQQLVRQKAFERLKGGEEQLNDLTANTLMNWYHMIDASAKNRAALEALKAAENNKIAEKVSNSESGKGIVWAMEDGHKVTYRVDDPYVMTALQMISNCDLNNAGMKAMRTAKHWLTKGVTVSPFFKVRNLISDSISSLAADNTNRNAFKNASEGIKLSKAQDDLYWQVMAGGGIVTFDTELTNPEAIKRIIAHESKDWTILHDQHQITQFFNKNIRPLYEEYEEWGEHSENANRLSLYQKLVNEGAPHAEAAQRARDLMDFTQSGAWKATRVLIQITPFMNARMQGLYKMGKSTKEDPARVASILFPLTLASIGLMAYYKDDPDWKKREDWDRNTYFWFKVGNETYRIPKPFELGAIATVAERTAEYLTNNEMTGSRFLSVLSDIRSQNLDLFDYPAAIKPIIEIMKNEDMFTHRQIESMTMQNENTTDRYNAGTSMIARGLSKVLNPIGQSGFPYSSELALSPVQIDHLIKGYFSSLGAFVVGGADMAVRSVTNEPTQPAVDYFKLATGNMVQSVDSGQSRYVTQMYQQAKQLEQVMGSYNMLRRQGRLQEAQNYYNDNKSDIARYQQVERVKREEGKLSRLEQQIEFSTTLNSEEKRAKLIQINKQKSALAQTISPK